MVDRVGLALGLMSIQVLDLWILLFKPLRKSHFQQFVLPLLCYSLVFGSDLSVTYEILIYLCIGYFRRDNILFPKPLSPDHSCAISAHFFN
jgi:hypothetical protein